MRAPTEIKSTPVSAIARTSSRLTPPEASSEGPSPAAAFSSRRRTASRSVSVVHVVEQQPVGAGAERVGDLVEVAALDLDRAAPAGRCGRAWTALARPPARAMWFSLIRIAS